MKSVTVFKIVKAAITIWRFYDMYKRTSKVMRNIGIGLAAGTAVAAIGSQVAKKHRSPVKHMKKSASKAMNTVSNVISDVSRMMK